MRKGVWEPLAAAWQRATGDTVDVSSPLLTVAGLRLPPPELQGEALRRFRALEPAWRLSHSVALLQIHRARTRIHMAHHAQPQREARRAAPRDILRAIKQRVAERLRFEHAKAKHADAHARDHKAWLRFHKAWIATGVATLRKGVLLLNVFSAPPPGATPEAGEVHIRVAAAHKPASGKRPPASGWALSAHAVGADGGETWLLTASGAIPAEATHGGATPAFAPPRHTSQAAQHMAAVAALTYAQQLKARGVRSRISTESVSVARSARAGRDQPEPPPRGAHSKAAKLVGAKAAESATREKVTVLTAVPAELLARAEKAAYLKDVQAHVLTARQARQRAVSLWDESRVWDPGD